MAEDTWRSHAGQKYRVRFPRFFLLAIGAMIFGGVDARELELTLQDALDLAMEDGYEGRRIRLDLLQAEQDLKATQGRFGFQAQLDMQAPSFNERVQSIRIPNMLPTFNTVGDLIWSSTLRLQQSLPTNGILSLTSDLRQNKQSVLVNATDTEDETKRFQSTFRLQVLQPLLVPNQRALSLERARLELEQGQRRFTRAQLDLAHDVTQSFYQFYGAIRSREIAREEFGQKQQAYDLAKRKHEAGLIAEVEALLAEVELAQSQNDAIEADGTLLREADHFKVAIGLRLENEVTLRPSFELPAFEVDDAKALEHGLLHSADIRDGEIRNRLAEINVDEVDAQSAIRADIRAYYERVGVSDPSLVPGVGINERLRSSFDDLEERPRNIGVFVNVAVPIWDGFANRSAVRSAEAFRERQEVNLEELRQFVATEIRGAVSRFRETRGRVEALQTSEKIATRVFEISLARFENGETTSQELTEDLNRLTRARQSYLDAYVSHQVAIADLRRQTLYDFEAGGSLVE